MSEFEHHKALVEVVRLHTPQWPFLARLFQSIPNEIAGTRPQFRAIVTAGALDTQLLVARLGYHGLCLELKDLGRTPSKAQRETIMWLTDQGFLACWVQTWVPAWDLMQRYLKSQSITIGMDFKYTLPL